ncbi:MAG: LysM peptidoglycan-binding domain-containing protein [Clostridia bacterium]|nr:LysM peptidoglycan-binding domain-containing protein [Clostridia bacterium]
MDKIIGINATAVSHSGMGYSDNEDNFYMNGRHMYEYERDNIQVSVENRSEEYIFAVSCGMDRVSNEKGTSISMMKELKKFQEKIRGTGGDLVSKIAQMKESVEEVNNVIYSMNIGKYTNSEKATSFAGIFILDGKAVAISCGKSRVYHLRDDNMKLIAADSKKAERLLKMGIITNEQAKTISGHAVTSGADGHTKLNKSELIDIRTGDKFLICSDGICSILEDEHIHEILSTNKDTGYISNILIKEAMKKGSKDNITALVIRVEGDGAEDTLQSKKVKSGLTRRARLQVNEKSENTRTIIASVIACILVVGILITVFYKAWTDNKQESQLISNSTTATTTTSDNPDNNSGNESAANGGLQEEQTAAPAEVENNNETGSKNTEENEDKGNTEGSSDENSGETQHKVETGDTLEKISKKYYGSMGKYRLIMERNNITNPNQLKVGQVLIIPKE